MKVDVYRLRDDQVLCRFVELPKLFELLAGGRSFFPTVSALKRVDPFECNIPVAQTARNVGRRTLEREAISLVRYLPEEFACGDIVEDYKRCERILKRCDTAQIRQHVREMRLVLMQLRIICNCWHAQEGESDAMWKLYAANVGVMLVSTVKKLRDAIRGSYSTIFCSPNPQEYTIAAVRYVKPAEVRRLPRFYVERPWLLKRASFAHEREVRVSHELPWIISPCYDGGMFVNLNATILLSEIVLSPFNPSWTDAPITSAIRALLEKHRSPIPIRKSDHMRPPAFESAVLSGLSILKLRDMTGAGGRLRMESAKERFDTELAKIKIAARKYSGQRSAMKGARASR